MSTSQRWLIGLGLPLLLWLHADYAAWKQEVEEQIQQLIQFTGMPLQEAP